MSSYEFVLSGERPLESVVSDASISTAATHIDEPLTHTTCTRTLRSLVSLTLKICDKEKLSTWRCAVARCGVSGVGCRVRGARGEVHNNLTQITKLLSSHRGFTGPHKPLLPPRTTNSAR
ncbi:uncharacterized protein LOC128201727 [Galleria mellonella]|uniref:Uncharacterized protein LOC128201727 n=1 Tax=Galleria mellonella TaxID=7137 RepID=A0ABM3MVU7_GALME|nr:uncharacterized protein LOC128201727 [Galleria mellonella]